MRASAAAATILLILLIALRLPSLVEPAGGDQGLYGYAGTRILAGDVMYRDMWDQKPPAIAFLYAGLWALHHSDAIVPGADLVAAALTAALLVVIGHRRGFPAIGYGAAALLLLFGDPYLQRLSGVYVRGQCEPFIAFAIACALALLAHPLRTNRHVFGAGVALGVAFWLKYNAATYGLPVLVATWAWAPRPDRRAVFRDASWVSAGFAALSLAILGYFAWNSALGDLYLATIDYNLRYSNETYEGQVSVARYLATFPLIRARIDMIWFLGGLGIILLALRRREPKSVLVIASWVIAAILSIAINGSRSLPNYFVQANPALALAAGGGLGTLAMSPRWARIVVAVLLAAALWRVGDEAPVYGLRLGGLPGLVENVRYDLAYIRGATDRDTYLSRFKGQKFDALEIDRLARDLRATTSPEDHVFVFGFSGGSVCWKSGRASASRFFWSRPVIIEFAADRPGYGSAGLLKDLELRKPAVVALQKEEWRSQAFFMNTPPLRGWLEAAYTFDRETPMFQVWRRSR